MHIVPLYTQEVQFRHQREGTDMLRLLNGIPEGKFRVIEVDPANSGSTGVSKGDFDKEKAFSVADSFNGKRRLPFHRVRGVFDHSGVLVRSEKDVGVPIVGLG